MELEKYPLYYEIAFSFFDPKVQVDTFEKIIKRFSKISVRKFLDICCGPSLQLREIARRGYDVIGLDLSPEMLAYLRKKAEEEGLKIKTIKADMANFKLEEKVDFAFIMMGSLSVESNEKFLSHLDSVAASLNSGGLYFIQNMDLNWTIDERQSWTMERNGITVKTTFETHFKDIIDQICTEKTTTEVNDNGKILRFVDEEDLKFIFPQEFKMLVNLNDKFDFLGWWEGDENTWYLNKPIENATEVENINMVLLRKKWQK